MNVNDALTQKASAQQTVKNPNTYDKDMFLKIFAAQMKYQNPLVDSGSGGSSTDSIAQYATFAQLEQISNMANTMNLMMADNMVGKNVTVQDGINEVSGTVDKVLHDGEQAYLVMNGNKYLASKVLEVNR